MFSTRFLSPAFVAIVLIANAFPQTETLAHPCADSPLYAAETEFWIDAAWEESSDDECDTEESLLFPGVSGATEGAEGSQGRTRDRNRASWSVARDAGGEPRATLRQQGQSGSWSQRVEVRDDTLTRRRIGWTAGGWKLVAGDLDDPDLPIWPVGLPRRTLPLGWRRAPGTLEAGYGLSSPLPQGFAAGILQPRWKAWAARSWNPVETGDEPPWSSAWSLRHVATGISVSLPWTLGAQFTDTRITRAQNGGRAGENDSVAEQVWAANIASPGANWSLLGAVSKSGRIREEGPEKRWALATAWHHRFASSASMEVTARQRAAAWESSWDPALTAAAEEDTTDRGWGAGEYRVAGHAPLPFTNSRERLTADAETWRVWNPRVGTQREGLGGRLMWRGEGARVNITGTRRSARAASGTVSLYRYLEAETLLEANPKFRLSAFRAWNGSGPTHTGFFFGVEPAWGTLRATSGLKVETDKDDHLSARGSLGARWAFANGWNLDASAAAPCYPRWTADETRWRATVNYITVTR